MTPWTVTCQVPLSFTIPRVCSNSYPLSWWCYLTISSLGLNPYLLRLLHWRWILYCWAIGEAPPVCGYPVFPTSFIEKTILSHCIFLVPLSKIMCVSCSAVSNSATPCILPGSSVLKILQERVLEWVAIPFSQGSSWPRYQTLVSRIAGRFFTIWVTREAQLIMYA